MNTTYPGKLSSLVGFAVAAHDDGSGRDAYTSLQSSGWQFLGGSQLAGLTSADVTVGGKTYSYYTFLNASAIVARSADALIVSFRGTDSRWDAPEWLALALHYARFKPLIDAIDAYAAANGIKKVYAVGHSLGGAMVHGFMAQPNHQDTAAHTYEGLTIASPGYWAFGGDTRTTNFRNESDVINLVAKDTPSEQIVQLGLAYLLGAIPDPSLVTKVISSLFKIIKGSPGYDKKFLFDDGIDGTALHLNQHDKASYEAISRFLDEEGVSNNYLLASGGFPGIYEQIIVPSGTAVSTAGHQSILNR